MTTCTRSLQSKPGPPSSTGNIWREEGGPGIRERSEISAPCEELSQQAPQGAGALQSGAVRGTGAAFCLLLTQLDACGSNWTKLACFNGQTGPQSRFPSCLRRWKGGGGHKKVLSPPFPGQRKRILSASTESTGEVSADGPSWLVSLYSPNSRE